MGASKKPATGKRPPDTIEKELNARQELFCVYFTRPGTETFNNATLSYAEAYDYFLETLSKKAKYKNKKLVQQSPYERAYNVCSVEGRRSLRNPKINEKIEAKLNELYASENAINARLAKIAYQETDPSVSLTAIRDINKLRRRLTPKEDPDAPGDVVQTITRLEIIMPPGMKVKAK